MGTLKSRLGLGLFAVTIAACGGAQVAPEAERAWAVVEAPAPSVREYDTRSEPDPVIGRGDRTAIEAAVREAASTRGVALEGDRRLARLAEWVTRHIDSRGSLPPAELTRFFAHHLGLVEPTPHLITLAANDPIALHAGVRESVGKYLDRQPYDHFGVSLARQGGTTLAVVAMSERKLTVRPFPRAVAEGGSIVFAGELAEGLTAPRLLVGAPSGQTHYRSLGDGPSFEIDVPLAERGVHDVELAAESEGRQVVIARFPLFVGVEPPTSVDLAAATPTERGPVSPDAFAAELIRLANEARREAGLRELLPHPELAEVSRRHSEDMAANDFLAHESPRTGGPAARASAGGVESALLLENVGRGPSAVDVHRGFMASPGHRGNLLNEGATHIGVGVVARPHGERIDYIVTVMFISVAAEIDPDRAADELLTAINAARRARNVPPIEAEPNLAAPARRAAGRFFEEPTSTQRELVDSATAEVRGLSLPYLRTGGVMALATEVTEAAELESLLEPNLRYVGIGVAQGTRPGRPPNSLAIVVLMAWPR